MRGGGGESSRGGPGSVTESRPSALIVAEQLTKYYGATRAVDGVSFSVGVGEVAALLGPNGSGKSTVMRMLTGYFSPTAGRVRVGGVDVAAQPILARRRVGYLPEQVALYPELTVRRYLTFVAGVKGLGGVRLRAAVAEALERCALGEVADRYAGKLSRGYRQRVGLAQALIGDPAVLVLDEATVGLDPVQAVEMRALLRSLSGRTVLLSTHVLSEAAALCSRIIILDRGRVLAEDTPDGLARRLAGVERLVVRIEGPAEDVATALAGLPGVTAVEREPPDGRAGACWRVVAPVVEPVERALAPLAVGRGWTLLEMQAVRPTLEDLFVRVVDAGGAGSA
jgi:ABC-2 type transport system ATP-binding protein